ncbi:MAG: RDD family protein [Pseudohongiellaceae bacterium]
MSDSLNTDQPGISAGLLRRLSALLYDSFLIAAIWMLLGFLLQLVVGPDTSTLVDGRVETNPVLDVVLFALMLGSCLGFYLWFWCQSGQTLGMLAWRIRLVDRAGGPVSWQQALLRWLLAWPAFFALGLGYFWLYFNPDRITLHDRWSQTRVILQPKP